MNLSLTWEMQIQSVLDLDSGGQRSCSGCLPSCGDSRQAPCIVSHLRCFTVSEDYQISGLLPVLDSFFKFIFKIFIYLAVSGFLGSLVVACKLGCLTALGILIPSPGIDPTSPALQGKFLTAGHQGSPRWDFLACKTHSSSFQVLSSSLKDTFLSSLHDLLVGLVYSS